MLNPSDIASKRIELWLSRYLEEELDSAQHGSGASAHLIDILEGSVLYAQNTKVRTVLSPPTSEVLTFT